MTDINQPLFSSIADATRRLGIGRTKLYELIETGKLHPIKIGSRTLLPERELQRFARELIEEAAR